MKNIYTKRNKIQQNVKCQKWMYTYASIVLFFRKWNTNYLIIEPLFCVKVKGVKEFILHICNKIDDAIDAYSIPVAVLVAAFFVSTFFLNFQYDWLIDNTFRQLIQFVPKRTVELSNKVNKMSHTSFCS